MRTKKLNPRLEAMASYVEAGESVADIGADHGYLPIWLVREGVSPFAILTDVQEGPLEKTRASVEKAGVERRVVIRQGDGLKALKESEVDVVVIAGMGGETILEILAADQEKTRSFKKYILQPRTRTEALKAWLTENKWPVLAETEALEKGRTCNIIVCSP